MLMLGCPLPPSYGNGHWTMVKTILLENQMKYFPVLSLSCFLLACGPNTQPSPNYNGDGGLVDGDGGAITADASPIGSGNVTGTVWAPGNAPGMVPAGHEIPISNALVYISLSPPAPIPQMGVISGDTLFGGRMGRSRNAKRAVCLQQTYNPQVSSEVLVCRIHK